MRVPGRVTIAIPTFNRSLLAERAVRSAVAQSYRDLEVVVSDDVSSDDTAQRIGEIRDSRLVFYRQPQRLGLVGNFDFCLRAATGEFFILVGDDDVLLPGAIEGLVEPFLSTGGESVGMVWCPCRIADTEDSPFWITETGPERESPVDLLVALWAGRRGPRLSSIVVRTGDAVATGGFLERHGHLCDIGTWASAALLHDWVVCVNRPLVQYTNHFGSTTSKSPVPQWQEWANVVHADLVTAALARAGTAGQQKLKRAKSSFISGITLTILVQTIGRQGWIRNACREAIRSPRALLTPYVCRRFFNDGWKILRLRGGSRRRPRAASV
ncbi:MAG TPA: glycosyltransferase [Bryobacteraceae bacterium]|jgi:glycosyltransferase involved in cell wall biosynthesis